MRYKQADTYGFSDNAIPITKKEIDEVYTLMREINPKDFIEALHGAQIIVGHLLGMRKLAQPNLEDQHLGLKLFRLSSDALERLERVVVIRTSMSHITTVLPYRPSSHNKWRDELCLLLV